MAAKNFLVFSLLQREKTLYINEETAAESAGQMGKKQGKTGVNPDQLSLDICANEKEDNG